MNKTNDKKDLLIAGIVFLIALITASYFDLNEVWVGFARQYEEWELDEFPIVLSMLFLVSAWYAVRRWREKDRSEQALKLQITANNEKEKSLCATQKKLIARSEQLTQLRQMTEYLMLSISTSECISVFSQFSEKVLASVNGAVYLNNGQNILKKKSWGMNDQYIASISRKECWALRTNRVYSSDKGVCSHPCHQDGKMHICFPISSGELMHGIVTLYNLDADIGVQVANDIGTKEELIDYMQPACNVLAIALSNVELHNKLSSETEKYVLTGLLNRKGYLKAASRSLKNSVLSDKSISFVMFDLDYFKTINDEHGHNVGDTALTNFADLITNNIRGRDIFCRYGGEEFLLILPDTDCKTAYEKAEELRQEVEQADIMDSKNHSIRLTVSGGVACFPENGKSLEQLVTNADEALYQAKAQGRNRIIKSTQAS